MTYRMTTAGGIFESTHRLAYRRAFGEIPEGFDIHHTCGNKECQNPWHLQALSRKDHMVIHMTGNTRGSYPVAQIHPEHGLLKVWKYAAEATRAGLGTNINKACKGQRETASGCWWMEVYHQ